MNLPPRGSNKNRSSRWYLGLEIRAEIRPLIRSVILALAVAAAAASGCRKPASPPPGASSDPRAGARARPSALGGKPLRIAMIAKSSSNPAFLSARTGAENRARELAVEIGAPIEIDWLTPPTEDGQVQAQRVLQAVNQLVDGILISCSDDVKVAEAIDDAVGRGVAVMTFDSDAPTSRRFAFCGVDDFKLGQQLMTELAGLLPEPGKSPHKVAVLAGNKSAPNLRRRLEGVESAAARLPQLKIIGSFFHAETAQDASAEVLRVMAAHPDIAGWVMLGGWPLYNRTLLRDLDPDAGKSRYKIVSVNALPPQLVYVEKGFAPVLLAQPTYLWGSVGVDAIVKKLLRKAPVPPVIELAPIRVTAGGLGTWARQLKAWGFGDVPDEYLRLK